MLPPRFQSPHFSLILAVLGVSPAFSVGSRTTVAQGSAARAAGAQESAPRESADERYSFLVGLCDEREWRLAEREARAFLADFPRHAKADLARYRLANALFELGDRPAAREVYAQLERRPEFEFRAEVLFRLGQCELALGSAAQAISAFERVRALPSHYLAPAAEFFLAEARFAAGEFELADEGYARVLASSAAREYEREARYGQCWCAFRLARHEQALERIAQYLGRHAQHESAAELRYLAGEVQLAAQRPREALQAFAAVPAGPFAARALRGRAFASSALGDHAAAARSFAELERSAPQGEFAAEAALQHGIQKLLAGDARGAASVLAQRANDAESRYWLARARHEGGDSTGALAVLDQASATRPAGELLERLSVLRGDVLSALGRADEATEAYSAARNDYALHAAAITAFNAGKLEDAARTARGLLAQFPQSSFAASMRLVCGEEAFARKDYAAASREFDAAASDERSPQASRARASLRGAWCALLAGDAQAALERAQRTSATFTDVSEAQEALIVAARAADEVGRSETAIAAWSEYLRVQPRGAHAADALAGLMRVDRERAAQWSARLAQEFPDSPAVVGALFELAEREANDGRTARAVELYREVLQRWPEHSRAGEARYSLAWRLFESGDFAGATRELERLAQAGGLDVALASSAAELAVWAASRAGERAGALAAYQRFRRLGGEPRKLLGAARLAGAALVDAGRTQEARALFDELLSSTRGDRAVQAEVLLESAWIALDAADVDEAEAALRTGLKLGPAPTARASLARALFFAGELRFDAGEFERARALYELALADATPDVAPQVLYKLGFANLRVERIDQAALAFARVGAEHAGHELAGEARYLSANCRFRQRRYAECAQLLASFVRESPRHACVPKALLELGVASGELGNWSECEAALSELARRDAKDLDLAQADLWRGRAARARGDVRAARASLERVLAADQALHAALARLELGQLDADAGKHEDALVQFLKVALLYEGGDVVPQALLLAANSLESLERFDKARARYAEVLEKHPDSAHAARARERLDSLARR